MKLPELLCPAGDEAALKAAVDLGADAVYLGYSRFGARASATNFDAEALGRAVRYAHLYHARVHVTVNTLVKQDELADVREALRAIADSGADAIITQDLGVASIAAREFPTLALHASTQMALMNAEDALWAKSFGFKRVVLARECSLEDIRAVAATGIETEVFAHGALCAAVSGRCLMSSAAGGRSGNRGRCAQPCRMRYTLGSREGALLSTRDLCLIGDLPALCEAGVASLKIEGRLKSAEYVAVVTAAYRRALDSIASGSFKPDDKDALGSLAQIFNRGGFTRGHAMGAEDASLCDASRVNHFGVHIGEVESAGGGFAGVRLSLALNDGDSLRICGSRDIELRYSGKATDRGQVARVRLRQGDSVMAGDKVFRLADARQLDSARNHSPRPIPISMRADFRLGEPMRLTVSDGEASQCVIGSVAEPARSAAATASDARRQLEKLGGTPFALLSESDLVISMDEGLFLPVGALNALRRDAVDGLIDARIKRFGESEREASQGAQLASKRKTPCRDDAADVITPQTLAVIFSDASIARELCDAGASMLIYEPADMRAEAVSAALDALPSGVWLQLPQQANEAVLRSFVELIRANASRLGGVCLGSIGQAGLDLPLPIIAGEGVPICSREAVAALAQTQARGFVLWSEWTRDELAAMRPFDLPALLKVYGREQLMLLNHCPERVARGLTSGRERCGLCEGADMACGIRGAELKDYKGHSFPLQRLITPDGCILRVLNSLPTLLADVSEREGLNAGALLHFTTEPRETQISLTRAYARLMRGERRDEDTRMLNALEATEGRRRRGVE